MNVSKLYKYLIVNILSLMGGALRGKLKPRPLKFVKTSSLALCEKEKKDVTRIAKFQNYLIL